MSDFKFLKVRDVKSPERGSAFSAGIDFFIPNDFENKAVFPGHDYLIPSGIIVKLPHGYMLMGADKSGIATSNYAKIRCGIKPKANVPESCLIVGAKIIDEDYPGELHIHIINVGTQTALLKAGMKIAQFILVPVSYKCPVEVKSYEELNIIKTDRTGGFSSTNKLDNYNYDKADV